uniref:Reverse transcriptase domain-containing protein n=1 Tax=Tanacetum cinerariifolium TaxID=118510 RepID=A0A6L2K0W9_TANCI|nr:hypothetical protein [Tanacetum cinerariifolium]
MEEINNFQQEPDESLFRAWERFKELLMKRPQRYLTEMQEVILFYNGLDVPTRKILDSKGTIPTKTAADAKIAIQEMDEYSHKWHNGTSSKARSSQHRNIFSKIVPFPRRLQNYCCDDWKEAQDVKILEAYDHTLPQKEKDSGSFTLPCFIHNVCFDKTLVDLGESVSVMPFSTYTNLCLGILSRTRLTIELADSIIKQPRGIAENMLVRIGKFIFSLILGRPFLSIAHSKIDVYKRKFTLRVREEKLVF